MTDSVESFSGMLRQALDTRLDPDARSFLDMFAEDGVMEFPFSYPGLPDRLEGREALATHLGNLSRLIMLQEIGKPVVLATVDPGTVVLEFEGRGTGVATGEPYEQRYISVIRIRAGRIVHYTDYWNPLAILRATHGTQHVAALVGEMHHG